MNFDRVRVVRGSLLDIEADAIVNAANTLMRGGGGIDGKVHQRAGQKMLWELQRIALETVLPLADSFELVTFAMYGLAEFEAFQKTFERLEIGTA